MPFYFSVPDISRPESCATHAHIKPIYVRDSGTITFDISRFPLNKIGLVNVILRRSNVFECKFTINPFLSYIYFDRHMRYCPDERISVAVVDPILYFTTKFIDFNITISRAESSDNGSYYISNSVMTNFSDLFPDNSEFMKCFTVYIISE